MLVWQFPRSEKTTNGTWVPYKNVFEPGGKQTDFVKVQQHESTLNAERMLAAKKIIDPKYGIAPVGGDAKKGGGKSGGKKKK